MCDVICLCCQCGREIHKGEGIHDVNDEKWCDKCVEGAYTFPGDNDDD